MDLYKAGRQALGSGSFARSASKETRPALQSDAEVAKPRLLLSIL